MRVDGLIRTITEAAMRWNFRWGPFAYITEQRVESLPPATFTWHSHEAITAAAVAALPEADRAFLEPELELLIDTYCGFPDQNWMTYGVFNEGYPERFPDCRRAWDISGYCRFHPLTKAGEFIGHGPPTTTEGARRMATLMLEAFRSGRHRDAVRHLGALLHYVEDAGTPGHVIQTSGAIHHELDTLPDELVGITGYEPALLAESEDELVEAVAARVEALTAEVRPKADTILEIMAREGIEAARDLHVETADDCARAAADVLHTVARVMADRPRRVNAPAPVGVELLPNGSFELDYDWDGVPDGWHVRWHDLRDRDVIAERTSEVSYAGMWSVKLARTPAAGVEWVPCWPLAVDVEPGQEFELTARVRAEGATGDSFPAAYFHRNNTDEIGRARGEALAGDFDWTRLAHHFTIPEGAERLLVGLRSEGNAGTVWFDSVSLVRR
ncbi:MAG: hypothetical protein J7M38_07010 [Armatimonadetes bacterium]|nr:hypothetical protein [Armatimonadota bacterium]